MTEKHKLSRVIDLVCQARDALSPKEQAVFDEMMGGWHRTTRCGARVTSATSGDCVDSGVRAIKWLCCCSRPRPTWC
jgi:hypothetical protein